MQAAASVSERKTFSFVFFGKALAILLVLNSHCDTLYPIPALATGGALGNALFFALSGFCLSVPRASFGSWYAKRLRRIYPPTIFMLLVSLPRDLPIDPSPLGLFTRFVWPTPFWFIGAIALFYALFYALRGIQSKASFFRFAIGLTLLYAAYYLLLLDTSIWVVEANLGIKLIFYFGIMMLGRYIALHCVHRPYRAGLCLLHMGLAFVSLYGVKFLMDRFPALMHFQFFNQLSVLWFTAAALLWGLQMEPRLEKAKIHRIAAFIASITLEIYLVQSHAIRLARPIPFPINLLCALAGTLAAAKLLNWAFSRLNRFLSRS